MTMKKKIIYSIGLATILMITGCSSSEPENSEQDPEGLIIEAPKETPVLAHTCSGNMEGTDQVWASYETSDGKVAKFVINVSDGRKLTDEQFNNVKNNYIENLGVSKDQIVHKIKDGKSIVVVQYNSFDEFNNAMDNTLTTDDGDYVFNELKKWEFFTACDGVATGNTTTNDTQNNQTTNNSSVPTSGIRPEFKEMMDNFVVFYQQYADFMNNADPNSSDYYTKYIEVMQQYTDTMAAMEKVEDMDMNTDEMKYYLEKLAEIQKILATVQTN